MHGETDFDQLWSTHCTSLFFSSSSSSVSPSSFLLLFLVGTVEKGSFKVALPWNSSAQSAELIKIGQPFNSILGRRSVQAFQNENLRDTDVVTSDWLDFLTVQICRLALHF